MNSNDFMSESQLTQAQRNLIMNLFSPVIQSTIIIVVTILSNTVIILQRFREVRWRIG